MRHSSNDSPAAPHASSVLMEETRYRRLAKATTDAVWEWDLVTDSIVWDEAMAGLFGCPTYDGHPTGNALLRRVHPEDREHVTKSMHIAIDGAQEYWTDEYRLLRKDGGYAFVQDQAYIARDRHGRAVSMIGGVRDITARKEAELKVMRLNQALQMVNACNELLIRVSEEKQLFRELCQLAVDHGGYRMVWVGYAEQDARRRIQPVAYAGDLPDVSYLDQADITWDEKDPRGQGPGGITVRQGRPVVCEDLEQDCRFGPWQQAARELGYRSLITLPLRGQERVLGILALYSGEARTIASEEVDTLQRLADNLAFGMTHLRSQQARRRIEAAIVKLAAGVSSASGEAFFEKLACNMSEALEADGSFVAKLLPGEPATARTLCAVVDGAVVTNFDYPLQKTPCEAFLHDTACVVPDQAAEKFPLAPRLAMFGARAYVGWRLDDSSGKPVGLLYILYRKPLEHVELVVSTLQIFAARAASELERQEKEMLLKRQASLLDKAQDAIIVCGIDQRIQFWNAGAQRLYGWTSAQACDQNVRHLLGVDREAHCHAIETVLGAGEWNGRLVHHRCDGSTLPVEANWTLMREDDGTPSAIFTINTDITKRAAAEREIEYLAYSDLLTGLPNRRLLMDRLQHALDNSARNRQVGAVLFIDLDNFKTLNDTMGHDKGDLLLKQVATRLSACVDKGDTIGRLGGDEFIILLEELSGQATVAATEAEATAEKILAAFRQPFDLDGYFHLTTPSIGVALFDWHVNESDELLKRADLAMYQAKAAGRNAVRFFDPQMQTMVNHRMKLEADLREALRRQEFALWYQVQTDERGRTIGAEALLRWQHPQRGHIAPCEVIAMAEQTGLILPLGQWVLETACAQLAAWNCQPETASLSIAVNISARQFHHAGFVEHLLRVLAETSADPQRLKLELTESLLIDDVAQVIEKMNILKKVGIAFSLDDFGTGYSSLSYLKKLPLEELKIDRSFVHAVLTDGNDAAIARTVISLGDILGLKVVAEGVETEAQRRFLADNGCHVYQGYLFGQPLALNQFEAFLRHGKPQ